MTLEQIGKLDRWQVLGVYFTPRDERGRVVGSIAPQTVADDRTLFFRHWRPRGLPSWRIEELWAAVQAAKQAKMNGRLRRGER